MFYDARQIANQFIRLAEENDSRTLSIMTVLKLVYFAHGWRMALRDGDGNPLISETVEAWKYGPVVPSVYYFFRPQGVYGLSVVSQLRERSMDAYDQAILKRVYEIYGNMSAPQLSRLTHVRGGPWHRTVSTHGYGADIPDEWICAHFVDKMQRAKEKRTTEGKAA